MGQHSRLELNHDAIRDLLREGCVPLLEELGADIAAAAGDGYEAETFIGRNRARVTVRTATTQARIAEAADRTLSKAIEAGRR